MIDPAVEARQLVDLFHALSQTIDEFRVSDRIPPDTPREQLDRLKEEAQMLESRAHHFTAEAIGATLQAVQPDLAKIKSVTADARASLERLKDVSLMIAVATSAVSLGSAIAAGDPASIMAAAQALAQVINC
jgi:hypothetical protein